MSASKGNLSPLERMKTAADKPCHTVTACCVSHQRHLLRQRGLVSHLTPQVMRLGSDGAVAVRLASTLRPNKLSSLSECSDLTLSGTLCPQRQEEPSAAKTKANAQHARAAGCDAFVLWCVGLVGGLVSKVIVGA